MPQYQKDYVIRLYGDLQSLFFDFIQFGLHIGPGCLQNDLTSMVLSYFGPFWSIIPGVYATVSERLCNPTLW